MVLYAQVLSFSQEMTCSQEHSGTPRKVLLLSLKIKLYN